MDSQMPRFVASNDAPSRRLCAHTGGGLRVTAVLPLLLRLYESKVPSEYKVPSCAKCKIASR
eukprot:1218227-Alexandrium_andersonii.AAC.1